MTYTLWELIDLDRYPLDQPGSERYLAVVDEAQTGLRSVGCAVIADLVRSDAVARINGEIEDRKHTTHFSTEVMNPYFHTTPNPDFGEHHPVNTFLERSSGFIPGDSWNSGMAIDALFRAPELAQFLADCLEIGELHCYADPLAGLTANILDPGQQFTWHFDTNDFAVTVLVQDADSGGEFQYYPAIRSATDENFDTNQAVLDGGEAVGRSEGVHTLE
ncbi:MAG: arpA protein, partial [Acidimicrobiaceae bacterium]|nr:arpA protein [Acidimicrobiaceae bacterium]